METVKRFLFQHFTAVRWILRVFCEGSTVSLGIEWYAAWGYPHAVRVEKRLDGYYWVIQEGGPNSDAGYWQYSSALTYAQWLADPKAAQ